MGDLHDLLASADRPVDVFFRDDDADDDNPNLRRLLATFVDRAAPLNLQIIPGSLTVAGIRILNDSRAAAPTQIELNQHGWMHTNHGGVGGPRGEFGESRGYREQLDDIARGRQKMEDAFGLDLHHVFTPPWNRCTKTTFEALDALGFSVLSKEYATARITGYSFVELSATLDVFRWTRGEDHAAVPVLKPWTEIVSALAAQLSAPQPIGILIHHKVMDGAAFAMLETLLDALLRSQAVRLHTFRTLVAAHRVSVDR